MSDRAIIETRFRGCPVLQIGRCQGRAPFQDIPEPGTPKGLQQEEMSDMLLDGPFSQWLVDQHVRWYIGCQGLQPDEGARQSTANSFIGLVDVVEIPASVKP